MGSENVKLLIRAKVQQEIVFNIHFSITIVFYVLSPLLTVYYKGCKLIFARKIILLLTNSLDHHTAWSNNCMMNYLLSYTTTYGHD